MRVEADTAFLDGELSLRTAAQLLDEGKAAIEQGCTHFDLSGVGHVDSAALSLLLSWQRAAAEAGRSVIFQNSPASLASLATLYGVAEFLNS